jgi:hypothetical protein
VADAVSPRPFSWTFSGRSLAQAFAVAVVLLVVTPSYYQRAILLQRNGPGVVALVLALIVLAPALAGPVRQLPPEALVQVSVLERMSVPVRARNANAGIPGEFPAPAGGSRRAHHYLSVRRLGQQQLTTGLQRLLRQLWRCACDGVLALPLHACSTTMCGI